ncbi:MAG: hypothetical protein AAFP80_15450 [Pseudomonadota bacterium]
MELPSVDNFNDVEGLHSNEVRSTPREPEGHLQRGINSDVMGLELPPFKPDELSQVTDVDVPTPDTSTQDTQRTDRETWSVKRSTTKAIVWAIDSFFAFGVALYVPIFLLSKHTGLTDFYLWTTAGLISAIVHQLVATAGDYFEIIHCGKALPQYAGNPRMIYSKRWWYNFLVLDTIAFEVTGVVSAVAINVSAVLLSFKLAPVETRLFVSFVLGMTWFAVWALLEDLVQFRVFKRNAYIKNTDESREGVFKQVQWALWESVKQFLSLTPRGLFFNFWCIATKTASAVFAYWATRQKSVDIHGSVDLTEAGFRTDSVIVMIFAVCFIIPYVFFGMRVAGLILRIEI